MEEYREIFSDDLGTIQQFIRTGECKTKNFFKPRFVPIAIKPLVEDELDCLEKMGVPEKVSYSQRATPLVVVPKKDGQVRLCGDYKVSGTRRLAVPFTLTRQIIRSFD